MAIPFDRLPPPNYGHPADVSDRYRSTYGKYQKRQLSRIGDDGLVTGEKVTVGPGGDGRVVSGPGSDKALGRRV